MPYKEVKVYSDGSHYIGIPRKVRSAPKRISRIDDEIEKIENIPILFDAELIDNIELPFKESFDIDCCEDACSYDKNAVVQQSNKITCKELFERLYDETKSLSKAQRKKAIIAEMRPRFKTFEATCEYVNRNIERKVRNLVCRRTRMVRKANLHDFNYFVTFTYDDSKLDEQSFRKKLKNCLGLLSYRKGWRYIGVWERSPGKHRLHFHGIFIIPNGTMPGELIDVNDYSLKSHKRQITHQNTYFLKNFGRNDFEGIESKIMMGSALQYLMKYIEKTGEKIVYSRGLPQYFISDVTDEDVVCEMGDDEYKKLLLFDNFVCWDDGEYKGSVCPETKSLLRKSN